MKNIKIQVFLKNILGVYLIKYFWVKKVFSAIFKSIIDGTICFWHSFCVLRPVGGLFASFNSLDHHPMPGHSPHQKSAHQAVFEPPSLSLSLSKWRSEASDYGRGMTSSLPLSYWLLGESYMTPCRMAMHFFMTIRIRVKPSLRHSAAFCCPACSANFVVPTLLSKPSCPLRAKQQIEQMKNHICL